LLRRIPAPIPSQLAEENRYHVSSFTHPFDDQIPFEVDF
jgi:hypothetical protein